METSGLPPFPLPVLAEDELGGELGGLLTQHLSELDESLAALANKSSAQEGQPGQPFLERDTAEATGGAFWSGIQSLPAAAPPAPPPREARPVREVHEGLHSSSSRTHTAQVGQKLRSSGEGLPESLLRGIETQQLSITEALSNLEKTPMQALPAPETLTDSASKAVKAPPTESHEHRCRQCAILGLQTRALCQSLSGLGASVVKWSTRLVQSRQHEVVQLVLDYVQPLKHLDAQLEDLALELVNDLASQVQSAHDQVNSLQRWHWQASGAENDLSQLNSISSVLRSPQFLAMDFSMHAMRPENDERPEGPEGPGTRMPLERSHCMQPRSHDLSFPLGASDPACCSTQTASPTFGQPEGLHPAETAKIVKNVCWFAQSLNCLLLLKHVKRMSVFLRALLRKSVCQIKPTRHA